MLILIIICQNLVGKLLRSGFSTFRHITTFPNHHHHVTVQQEASVTDDSAVTAFGAADVAVQAEQMSAVNVTRRIGVQRFHNVVHVMINCKSCHPVRTTARKNHWNFQGGGSYIPFLNIAEMLLRYLSKRLIMGCLSNRPFVSTANCAVLKPRQWYCPMQWPSLVITWWY